MPSMCAEIGALENGLSLGRQDDVDAAAVARTVLPGHQAGLGHAVDQARDAAGGESDVAAQGAHGQAALGGRTDVDEHVEEHEGDADRLLQLALECIGQPAVRADDQAHQMEAFVVDLAQDTAGAAPVAPGSRLRLIFAAPLGNGRSRHGPQSLPKWSALSGVSD